MPTSASSSSLTLEKGKDWYHTRGRNVDGQLVLPHGELLNVLGQAAHQPGAVSVQVIGLGLVLVGRVDNGRLEGAERLTLCQAHVLCLLGKADLVVVGGGRHGKGSGGGGIVAGSWDRGTESLSQRSAPADFAGHLGYVVRL